VLKANARLLLTRSSRRSCSRRNSDSPAPSSTNKLPFSRCSRCRHLCKATSSSRSCCYSNSNPPDLCFRLRTRRSRRKHRCNASTLRACSNRWLRSKSTSDAAPRATSDRPRMTSSLPTLLTILQLSTRPPISLTPSKHTACKHPDISLPSIRSSPLLLCSQLLSSHLHPSRLRSSHPFSSSRRRTIQSMGFLSLKLSSPQSELFAKFPQPTSPIRILPMKDRARRLWSTDRRSNSRCARNRTRKGKLKSKGEFKKERKVPNNNLELLRRS
jgi:hypothetical protein